jgi:hypothetical protein
MFPRCRYRVAQRVMSLDLTAHTSLSPRRVGFAPSFVNYNKGCTRLAAASDKVYQLRVQGSPASSTTKTDLAEILPKVVLKHQKINQSNPAMYVRVFISLARRKHLQTSMYTSICLLYSEYTGICLLCIVYTGIYLLYIEYTGI